MNVLVRFTLIPGARIKLPRVCNDSLGWTQVGRRNLENSCLELLSDRVAVSGLKPLPIEAESCQVLPQAVGIVSHFLGMA